MRIGDVRLQPTEIRFDYGTFNLIVNAISIEDLTSLSRAVTASSSRLTSTRIEIFLDWLYVALVYWRGQPL
jgi:hypothetical protein